MNKLVSKSKKTAFTKLIANKLIEEISSYLNKCLLGKSSSEEKAYSPERFTAKFLDLLTENIYSTQYFIACVSEFYDKDVPDNADLEVSQVKTKNGESVDIVWNGFEYADGFKLVVTLDDEKLFEKFRELTKAQVNKYLFRRPQIRNIIAKTYMATKR